MKTREEIRSAITFESVATRNGKFHVLIGVYKLRIGSEVPDSPKERERLADAICDRLCLPPLADLSQGSKVPVAPSAKKKPYPILKAGNKRRKKAMAKKARK